MLFPKLNHKTYLNVIRSFSFFAIFLLVCLVAAITFLNIRQLTQVQSLHTQNNSLITQLVNTNKQFADLKSQDQYKINQQLKTEIKTIQTTYTDSITSYQAILDLQSEQQKTDDLTPLYAQVVQYLSQTNYASAQATLTTLQTQIKQKQATFAQTTTAQSGTSANAPVSNTAPTNGFSAQQVKTDSGTFTVYLIAADLNTTRVIADTASDGNCSNNCPVLSLGDYVSRNSAYAGINGTFFCPIDYPSCAGKTNSFDTLLMNKNKTYFNSDNNVYSTVPAVIISGTSVRFVSASSQWGRDTSPDMVLAMQPLLVLNNQVVYSGSSDPKYNSQGPRGFIANIGSTVYIGDVLNATMQDSANVMHTLGMNNALNLDEGGSTALWFSGGYKLGPGRNLPNAVLFVRK